MKSDIMSNLINTLANAKARSQINLDKFTIEDLQSRQAELKELKRLTAELQRELSREFNRNNSKRVSLLKKSGKSKQPSRVELAKLVQEQAELISQLKTGKLDQIPDLKE